jgi:N-acetylneuraminic acid mutarotase
MPTPRAGLSAVVGTDGRIYAIGGEDASGNELSTVEAYSPSSNTWAAVASLPSADPFGAGIRDRQGNINYIGAHTYRYSYSTDTWTTLAPSPNAVYGSGGARGPDGRLYVFGGLGTDDMETSAAEAYNPSSGTWSSIASMPDAVFGLAAVRGTDGKIYAIDGGENYGESCCPVPTSIMQVLTI